MLERHELEVFLTLVEELHFGRTAERLRISTARASQVIAKLERRLGVPLFERSSRRVTATPAGRELYAELRPAWDRIGTAVQRTIDIGRGKSGTLTVGFIDAATSQLLARTAALFHSRLPEYTVLIREVPPAQVIPWLRADEIDIALGVLPVTDPDIATSSMLASEAQVVAVAVNHPLAKRRSVTADDIARTTLLTGSPTATLNEQLMLVGAGSGALLVPAHTPRYHPRPDVAYIPLKDSPPIEWALLWLSAGESARIREFARAATIVTNED
ncbi:LysR substrate-binding domain-containing protein [Nocardia sp. NPDC051030]|uniref:LysR family transcriptional regulator n=1 Tax=Nocardia sp. NPDC051030 TaxID=3155162 RepID=UPI0034293087